MRGAGSGSFLDTDFCLLVCFQAPESRWTEPAMQGTWWRAAGRAPGSTPMVVPEKYLLQEQRPCGRQCGARFAGGKHLLSRRNWQGLALQAWRILFSPPVLCLNKKHADRQGPPAPLPSPGPDGLSQIAGRGKGFSSEERLLGC